MSHMENGPAMLSGWWSGMGKLLCLVALLATAGCGSSEAGGGDENKVIYTATGTLTINGKPGAEAWVTLSPDYEGVPTPMARVDADGKFALKVTDADIRNFKPVGDPVGDYHLLVRWPQDPANPLSKDRLGGAFFDSKTFNHKVSIELGENTIEPVKIENATITD